MKDAGFKIYVDRQRLFLESWKGSVGDDLQIRRAKAFKHICDNVPISILPWELIVGKSSEGVVGAIPEMDIAGDYVEAIWDDDSEEARVGWSAKAVISDEDRRVMREAADMFRDTNPGAMAAKAIREVLGDWHDEIVDARIADPGLDSVFFGNSTSSCDFEGVLTNGLGSYITRAEGYIDNERIKKEPDANKIYFWKASIICVEGMINLAHRYADLARKQADVETDPKRKSELESIAEACMNVPEKPATSLQEALQSMAIVGVGKVLEHPMHNYPHWGRGDQYLYGYFINDVNSGKITVDEAGQMIAELVGRWGTSMALAAESVQDSHQVNYGINSMILGGYGQDHDDASNELTCLFLRIIGELKLSSPTVTVRWNPKTPDWMMSRAIECNLATRGGIPLFQNDDRTIKQYLLNGIPWNEACEWVAIGCVVPTLITRAEHYGMEGLAAINLAAMLWMALHNGRDINGVKVGVDCGDAREFTSIEQVKDALFAQERLVMKNLLKVSHIAMEVENRYIRTPWWSTVSTPYYFEDGRDLLFPDHVYTMFGLSDRAVIDVADSIMAIKHLVFDEKKLTMAELMDALDSDFAGERGEEIRHMCLAAPKFGNDIDEVDYLVKEISDRSGEFVKGLDNGPFRNMVISREGLSWHFAAGLGVGALPNGRHAFEPLDDGSFSPMGGADKNGPTAVLRSVLKAEMKDVGAAVLNQKFAATLLQTPGNREALMNYTKTFLAHGGTHIQYNIVDSQELVSAKETPDEYKDLIVRIGGFSAYFVQLSEEIQDDVINRTEHSL